MSLELWKSIFDWATIIFIALTVFTGAGALITGDKLGKRQEAQLRQFDAGLTGAKMELVKQQERAANADGLVAGLEQDVVNAKVEMAKQQTRAAQAESVLAQLRKRQEPRGFSEKVMLPILNKAKPGKARVVYQEGNPETYGFANSLYMFLTTRAGWQISEPEPVPSVAHFAKGYSFNTDVMLVMHDLDNPTDNQKAIEEALTAAGYRIGGSRDDSLPIDLTILVVAPRF